MTTPVVKRQVWSLCRISLGRELKGAQCLTSRWGQGSSTAGFCDAKSTPLASFQASAGTWKDVLMTVFIQVDSNTIPSEVEGKAGYRSSREAS